MTRRMASILSVIAVMAVSGCGMRGVLAGPAETAKTSFEEWAQEIGMPYKDVDIHTLSNDGTFAIVHITARFKESPEAEWLEKEADVECRKVGGQWQCDPWMYFSLTRQEEERVRAEQQFESQVIRTLNSLNSFRYTGTLKTEEGEAISLCQIEAEYAEPSKRRVVKRCDTGDVVETLAVADQECFRRNNGAWECGKISVTAVMSPREWWIKTIQGEPYPNEWRVVEHGSSIDTRQGEQCRLYYLTTIRGSDIQTQEVCFSLTTYYPVQGVAKYKIVQDDGTITAITSEIWLCDFNASIEEIVLPTP